MPVDNIRSLIQSQIQSQFKCLQLVRLNLYRCIEKTKILHFAALGDTQRCKALTLL